MKAETLRVGDWIHLFDRGGTYTVFKIDGLRVTLGTKNSTEHERFIVNKGSIKCKYGGIKIDHKSLQMDSIIDFYKDEI